MMNEFDGKSENILNDNILKLKEILPEAFSDENKIDFEKLKVLLGDKVDDSPERYDFTWNGKKQAIKISNTPTMATLRPNKKKSQNWGGTENLYIEGDNLEVLKLLQKSYTGKVKVIYIDPPYNTGHDFVYKDDFSDGIDNYLEQTGQTDKEGNQLKTNTESNGRFHTDWLNMMYPRLRLARNLLAQDGVIFVSIDENEIDNLKKLMSEIYGENNFMGQVTTVSNPRGRSQDKYIATSSEYLVIYSKRVQPNGRISVDKVDADLDDYPYEDKDGKYRLLELRNTHRDFGKFNRPNLYYPFYINKDNKVSLSSQDLNDVEVYPIWNDGFEGCWTWGVEKARENIDKLVAQEVNGNWKIFRKSYFANSTKQLKSVWNIKQFYTDKGQAEIFNLFNTKDKLFQAPKSVKYIQQIIDMGSNDKNDIVLDFFSGSSTTAQAVLQMNAENNENLRYIMVQLPEKLDKDTAAFKAGYRNIPELAEERIKRAGKKIEEKYPEADIDTGFKVFTLDKSNIRRWNTEPDKLAEQLNFISNFVGGRSTDDVVYELLLKQGLPLTSKIEKLQLNNCDLFVINEGKLFIALGNDIDVEVAKNILNYKNANDLGEVSVIFQDQGFANDADKLNTLETLKSNGFKEENVFSV